MPPQKNRLLICFGWPPLAALPLLLTAALATSLLPACSGDGSGQDASTDSGPDTPSCSLGQFETDGGCIDCRSSEDCDSDPALPVCQDGSCVACAEDRQCADKSASTPACAQGQCAACKPLGQNAADENTTYCSATGGSCDATGGQPSTYQCSNTTPESRNDCQSCTSDADCSGENSRCIAMTFDGQPHGFYCLPERIGACPAPYRTPLPEMRPSVSGAGSAAYCAVNEALTTCEAFAFAGTPCESDDDPNAPDLAKCGDRPGIRCENVDPDGTIFACTYSCGASLECNADLPTCRMGADRYCSQTPD